MKLIRLFLYLVVLCPALAHAEQKSKPFNFVFFLVDDLGWTDLKTFGSSFYDTPNCDRLAATAMKFTNAYAACPVCSPTRASIMTGRYPTRTGVTDYIGAPAGRAWRRNTRLLPAPYTRQLELKEFTIAEALKQKGYATFFAGKWHLGNEGFWPEDQGFDVEFMQLFPRPTPLDGDIVHWLKLFTQSFVADIEESEHEGFYSAVKAQLETILRDDDGNWFVDYVRLRFKAIKPAY